MKKTFTGIPIRVATDADGHLIVTFESSLEVEIRNDAPDPQPAGPVPVQCWPYPLYPYGTGITYTQAEGEPSK